MAASVFFLMNHKFPTWAIAGPVVFELIFPLDSCSNPFTNWSSFIVPARKFSLAVCVGAVLSFMEEDWFFFFVSVFPTFFMWWSGEWARHGKERRLVFCVEESFKPRFQGEEGSGIQSSLNLVPYHYKSFISMKFWGNAHIGFLCVGNCNLIPGSLCE